jgi:TnpA family transposase
MLVNYHSHEPLARLWGGGMLSSSDGQRFPATVESKRAVALPRYFGYGQGLTFYTWTSDQFSQYGSKPIPSTVRDATYVLDAILDNETELDMRLIPLTQVRLYLVGGATQSTRRTRRHDKR